jgi:hypothetical protein
MLPLPYQDLLAHLDAIPGFRGIATKAVEMGVEDTIAMLFPHVRPYVAKVSSKDKLNQYLGYGLRSYDSAVLSGVIDNELLDNDMIGKISEEFGIWESIRAMVAANREADNKLLKTIVSESEGLGLCVMAARLHLDYDLFISIVERKDSNANRILTRREDLPEEWKVIIALAGS